MSETFAIGQSNHNGTFNKTKYFYIEPNEDNIYRVLPPMFSLASKGSYAQWMAVHKSFPGTNGKRRVFRCIEETDRETKRITKHCPMCIYAKKLQDHYDMLKNTGGATEDQLKQFRNSHIYPLQAERKYWLNVVNQADEIGILSINGSAMQALKAECKAFYSQQGIDIVGTNGLFLNFRKDREFKGDRKPVVTVKAYLKKDASNKFEYVTHTLTPSFIERLKTEAKDLPTLFRSISSEDMELMVQAPEERRAELVDKIFTRSEDDGDSAQGKNEEFGLIKSPIPGTSGAVSVGRVSLTSEGASVAQLDPIVPQTAKPAAPAPAPSVSNTAPSALPDEFMAQMQAILGNSGK